MNTEQQLIVDKLTNTIFIIDQIMVDKKKYKKFIKEIFNYLYAGFEVKEFRECPVYFKFHEDSEILTLQLRHFLTNLIFWEPIMTLYSAEYLNETFLVDPTKISTSYIKNYIDTKFIIPYRQNVSNRKLNRILHDMMFNLAKISKEFNPILGLTMNMEVFMDLSNKNQRFNQIIRTKVDPNKQPVEIEDELHNLVQEEIQILMTEDNILRPILRSGTGIKDKQLSEFSINGGLKPDLDGNTISKPINSNLVVGGFNSVSGYYIDSLGGRKSLIFNKNVMGRSGHFARMSMLVVSDIRLRKDYKKCKSLHPIMFEIKTKEHLKRLVGRSYKQFHERNYKILQPTDTHLIGKKILVKSPMTCASHKGICCECYGHDLFHVNQGVGIGAYAGAIITNPVSQSVLSSKHLLTTNSEAIKFSPDFYKVFDLVANEIYINEKEVDCEDYSLIIINDNIVELTELDESEINEFVTLFNVRNNKTGEMYEIYEKDLKELYISPELKKLMKKNKGKDFYEIEFSKIPDETRLFLLQVENAELTRPLYNIMGILNTEKSRNKLNINNMHDLAQSMLDLLIESKINVMSVHAEVLLSPLIRSERDILEKPDFTKYKAIDDTKMLTISSALEKHPSVLIGLSFQFLGRQLLNPLTFKKKGSSFLDPFFSEQP